MADGCPRDIGSFCRIALIGHRLCPDRRGGCSVVDHEAAWEDVRQAAIARLSAKVRRLMRKERRP